MTTVLLLAALATLVSAVPTPPPEVYRNAAFGIEFAKPAGWTLTAGETGAYAPAPLSDKSLDSLVQEQGAQPLLVVTKYPEPYPEDINPTVTLQVLSNRGFEGRTGKELAELKLPALQRAFPDLKIMEPPKDTTLHKLKIGYAKIQYTLDGGEGRRFPTTSEVWAIPRKNFFIYVAGGTRQDEKTGSRAEIHKVVAALRIK
jgi:hypothetical protein